MLARQGIVEVDIRVDQEIHQIEGIEGSQEPAVVQTLAGMVAGSLQVGLLVEEGQRVDSAGMVAIRLAATEELVLIHQSRRKVDIQMVPGCGSVQGSDLLWLLA